MGSFAVGDFFEKIGGDYRFNGFVRAAVIKGSGAIRYVVEDDRCTLFIYRAEQIRKVTP